MLDPRKGIRVSDRKIGPTRSFRVEDELWEKVREMAKELDRSMSAIVRVALIEYLAREYDEVVNEVEYRYTREAADKEHVEHCRIKHNGYIDPKCFVCDPWVEDAERLGLPIASEQAGRNNGRIYDEPLKPGELSIGQQWEVSD